ncbi:hypothetical protein [Pseudalkalibacillus sp. SCS-8]|uniref:hypothetical protein n=1 Tax=Pseudalkalibacillus nanhaiensis TaxID=3115291 RepID=UPI0032DBD880
MKSVSYRSSRTKKVSNKGTPKLNAPAAGDNIGNGLRNKWPNTAKEMDDMLGVPGRNVPDGPKTPGRGKVVWEPNKNTKIIYEQHLYHRNAPDFHKKPHWHLDTPGNSHQRYLPGENIPGQTFRLK